MRGFLSRLRYVLLLAVFGLSSLALSLSPLLTSTVNATSVYDTAYRHLANPITLYSETCGVVDVTSMADSMITESNMNGVRSGFGTAFFNITEGESIGSVSLNRDGIHVDNELIEYRLTVSYNTGDPTVTPLQWASAGSPYTDQYVVRYPRNNAKLQLYLNGSCTLSWLQEEGGSLEVVSSSPPGDVGLQLDNHSIDLLPFCEPGVLCSGADATAFYNYPTGYEGDTINEAPSDHNLNFIANVSSYTVEFTAEFDTEMEGMDKFLIDFQDGDGENDYASHTNPNVYFYAVDGYSISCSIINETNEVCTAQWPCTYPEDAETDQQA